MRYPPKMSGTTGRGTTVGRILFITVDEQRLDALGCTGGRVARTPNLDALAAQGIVYDRAYVNNVTCMPSRATMVTGQHPATHGVYTNGVPLPLDAPSFADHLSACGYRAALIGKSHLQPVQGEPDRFWEVGSAARDDTGPYRGFDHVLISSHGKGVARNHYQVWMERNCPGQFDHYLSQTGADGRLNTRGGGDTGAIQVHDNDIARDFYHSYWLADRCTDWLDQRDDDENWFLWLSFGDPHHPFQPPRSERHRVSWRDLDLPAGHPGSAQAIRAVLADRPDHWLDFYEGRGAPCSEIPQDFVPRDMTHDQVREINAMVHVMNEIVDDAVGRVLAALESRGWLDDTTIVYTSDHGTFQGDYGLLFKGPFHVDALMRVPLILRPASGAGPRGLRCGTPVSLVDLAPSFCRAAQVDIPRWMQGRPLPLAADAPREPVIVEWDQTHRDARIQISTVVTRDHICSRYGLTDRYPEPEGELYAYADDPLQMRNLWHDPAQAALRDRLISLLDAHLPPRRARRLDRVAGA